MDEADPIAEPLAGAGETRVLRLAEIETDPAIQPRLAGIDAAWIGDLAEAGPEAWAPLRLVERGTAYVLVDGHHTREAALRLGLEEVRCEILRVPDDADLRSLAFERNRAHGRPLTAEDRKAEAGRILCREPVLADREVARRCGLSDKTVGAIRRGLEATAEFPQLPARLGADGKIRPVTPRPPRGANGDANGSTGPSLEDGRSGRPATARRSTRSPRAPDHDPDLAALAELVAHVCQFLEEHAGDAIGDDLAAALAARWPVGEWPERAAEMRTLGEQLIAAARTLDRRHDGTKAATPQEGRAA